MTMQFDSKVALVSNGSSDIARSIARAIALACAREGASFVIGHAHPVDGGRLI